MATVNEIILSKSTITTRSISEKKLYKNIVLVNCIVRNQQLYRLRTILKIGFLLFINDGSLREMQPSQYISVLE